MARMGFVFNLDTCLDHRGCMTACKMYNNTPAGVYNNETFTSTGNNYPESNGYFISISCQQCSNPSCVKACTREALTKREDGIVMVSNATACSECQDAACERACPYGAIHYDQLTGKAYKCDMCIDRIDMGKVPRCVEGCLTGSRLYGDFDDPESVVAQTVANWKGYVHQLKPNCGNEPNAYYLLSKRTWDDMDKLYTPNWHE